MPCNLDNILLELGHKGFILTVLTYVILKHWIILWSAMIQILTS